MKRDNSILISGIILLVLAIVVFVDFGVSYSKGIPNYYRGQPMTNAQGFLAAFTLVISALYVFYIYIKGTKL